MIMSLLILLVGFQIDEQLMDELANIKKLVNPNEILLVIDSMTGQNTQLIRLRGFDDKLNITGVILTKLDGDTRGGAAMCQSGQSQVKPIKFVGEGKRWRILMSSTLTGWLHGFWVWGT